MDLKRILPPFVVGLGLVVPAMAVAAGEVLDSEPPPAEPAPAPVLTPANVSPTAVLKATVEPDRVVFDASESRDPDGQIVTYEWDLDGDGTFELNTAAEPTTDTTYAPGTTVAATVRVTDNAGAGGQTDTSVTVPDAAPAPDPAPADPPKAEEAAADQPAPVREPAEPQPAEAAAPVREPRAADVRPAAKETEPTVVAAANGSVTIKDFEFGPASVTVGVGDSVTWRNNGPTVHTASAGGGEFDSGNLSVGQSFSHKFTKAGTYSYICRPHPFMTGKVVVTAASSDTSGSGSGSNGAGSGSGSNGTGDTAADDTTDDSTTAGGLPDTGADVFSWMAVGFGMLAFGAAMRWRLGPE